MLNHKIKLNIEKLNQEFKISGVSKSKVVKACGFTLPTLDSLLSGSNIKVSTLIAFAEFFNRPISYFFDEEPLEIRQAGRDYVEKGKIEHNSGLEVDLLREQISQLKSQLADKDQIITMLKDQHEYNKTDKNK